MGRLQEGADDWLSRLRIARLPELVSNVAYGLCGVFGLFVGLAHHWATFWWILASVAAFLAGVVLQMARSARERRLIKVYQTTLQDLLSKKFNNLLQIVAEALGTEKQADRKTLALAARASIVSTASHVVGKRARTGTRANLFKLSPDEKRMELEPGCYCGGDRSTRVFDQSARTFQLAMQDKGRFVEVAPQGLAYQTFLTQPVSVGRQGGQPAIHGVLTVDCPRSGDLVEADDVPMMQVLSTMIAMTYECEKYAGP
jgi:hypothetical protein